MFGLDSRINIYIIWKFLVNYFYKWELRYTTFVKLTNNLYFVRIKESRIMFTLNIPHLAHTISNTNFWSRTTTAQHQIKLSSVDGLIGLCVVDYPQLIDLRRSKKENAYTWHDTFNYTANIIVCLNRHCTQVGSRLLMFFCNLKA